jgi:hypothetical protein
MFKLIKILNSGSNVPEPIYLPVNGINAKVGTAMNLTAGKLSHCSATVVPTHVLLKDVKTSDQVALCYKISPDMQFEAPVNGSCASLYAGAKVKLYTNADLAAVGVSNDTASGVAKIVSLDGATAAGDKVTVVFD